MGDKRLKAFLSWEAAFVFATTLVTACLYFFAIPFLELVELKAWDLHFVRRGKIEPSGAVAFVSIDEESVNRDGRWPWPRRQMASLLEAVEGHGAVVIGLDMGFFEPDLKLRQQAILDVRDQLRHGPSSDAFKDIIRQLDSVAQQEDDDVILADVLRRMSIPLVLGHFFYFDKDAFVPASPPPDVLERAACHVVQLIREPLADSLNEAVGFETNIPIIREASRYAGSFNVFADLDGTVRWMPLVIHYEKRFFPSLALQTLSAALPDLPLIVKADDHGIVDIRLGPVSIPTNNKGELLVNYYGPGNTFPHFSATALLHDEAPDDCLKGRLVIIGNTTMGLHDLRPTPFAPSFPGVELHCTVMENILQQNFLHRSDRVAPYLDLAALLAVALLFLVLQHFTRGILLATSVGVLLVGYVAATHLFFLRSSIWLNHLYPSLNLIVAYVGTSAHHYLKEAREKRMIRQTFSLYVHRSVVEEMLAHPERLRLGGEKKELSVLFSDIRGFTSLSEELSPEVLVPQLNEYLTRMSNVVFENLGTLDKYIGDAIMAIFGAPLPQEDHPVRACATALDMVKSLHLLHIQWRERGQPVLQIGIGINTGVMMVGNMGSEGRFDYTVLGDNVNLASRLEGLTKMYGVPIVVSGATWDAVEGRFVGRKLDMVRVKGRQRPVAVYEVMDRIENHSTYQGPLGVYNEAMERFQKGGWDLALDLFQKVEEWWPGDPPSLLYQRRCKELLECPPSGEWSSVTVLDHK
jgi:adenylate cyclase